MQCLAVVAWGGGDWGQEFEQGMVLRTRVRCGLCGGQTN